MLQRYGELSPVVAVGVWLALCACQGLVFAAWVSEAPALEVTLRLPCVLTAPVAVVWAD